MHAGCNSFRISIEWSRLFPEQYQLDDEAVQRYNDIFDCLERHDGSFPQVLIITAAFEAALPWCPCIYLHGDIVANTAGSKPCFGSSSSRTPVWLHTV